MANAFLQNRNKQPVQHAPVDMTSADMIAIQKAQEELDREDKQASIREKRNLMMMQKHTGPVVDDSDMRAISEAMKHDQERVVDSKQRQAL